MYSKRILPWLDQFERDKVLIIKSEHMFANPSHTVREVADFLSVEIATTTQFDAKNTNSYQFEDDRVATFLEEQLKEECVKYNNWSY